MRLGFPGKCAMRGEAILKRGNDAAGEIETQNKGDKTMKLTEEQRRKIEWALFGETPVREYKVEWSRSVPGGIYAVVVDDPDMHCILAVIDGQERII